MILVESLASSCNEYLELFMKNWTRKEQSLRFREVEFLRLKELQLGLETVRELGLLQLGLESVRELGLQVGVES
jgi:hypothetical protein